MRRCTSHTGSSPLWYSTSSTPNSVVPSPKRAMLAREWRSTASNARASTIQSLRGTSARAAVGERFMLPPEPWGRVKLFPRWFEVKYLDFKTSVVGLEGGGTMVADLGLLALRVTLGVVFLGHGAQKAFGAFGGPGFAGAAGFIGSLGFRPARLWAGLAVGGELAAGLLFLLGLLTPLAGLLVLATMAGAVPQGDGAQGFFKHNGGGGGKHAGGCSPALVGGGRGAGGARAPASG